MAHVAVDKWFKSRKCIEVNGRQLQLLRHPLLPDTPLSIQKGQAEAFCLQAPNGERWILKKFHTGKELDRRYLMAVTQRLPDVEGCRAGRQRYVLTRTCLSSTSKTYYARDLAQFLDNTILMPQIAGVDWAGLADDVRDGSLHLSDDARIRLAGNLAQLVQTLESHGCAHRDLSSGNVFLTPDAGKAQLIDFDATYHTSLAMPMATTAGTAGYIAPFVWQGNEPDARLTWCPAADRYALALLAAEILMLRKGSPLTADGGMFAQDELRHRKGPSLNQIRRDLRSCRPEAADLLDTALMSDSFFACPAPNQWIEALQGRQFEPPSLADLPSLAAQDFAVGLNRASPKPTPALAGIEAFVYSFPLPVFKIINLSLPEDPWQERNT